MKDQQSPFQLRNKIIVLQGTFCVPFARLCKPTEGTKSAGQDENSFAAESNPACLEIPKDAEGKQLPDYKWANRKWIFSLYDKGIKVDAPGFYEVTPEDVSIHIAKVVMSLSRAANPSSSPSILSACSGYGGEAIHFAKYFSKVCGVDTNAQRLEWAESNARIYGCGNVIEWVNQDICDFIKGHEQFSWSVVSPPWGGSHYKSTETYRLDSVTDVDNYRIVEAASKGSKNMVIFLPHNQSLEELLELITNYALDYVMLISETIYINRSKKPKYTAFYFLDEQTALASFFSEVAHVIVKTLKEPPFQLASVKRLITELGLKCVLDHVQRACEIHELDGMKKVVNSESQNRTLGGIFFALIKHQYPEAIRSVNRLRKALSQSKSTDLQPGDQPDLVKNKPQPVLDFHTHLTRLASISS